MNHLTHDQKRTRTTLSATPAEIAQIDRIAQQIGLSRSALLVRLGLLAATYPHLAELAAVQVARDVGEHTRRQPLDGQALHKLHQLAHALEGGVS